MFSIVRGGDVPTSLEGAYETREEAEAAAKDMQDVIAVVPLISPEEYSRGEH